MAGKSLGLIAGLLLALGIQSTEMKAQSRQQESQDPKKPKTEQAMPAEEDSVKTYNLEEIVVTAKEAKKDPLPKPIDDSSFAPISGFDLAKNLSRIAGFNTPHMLIAEPQIHGLSKGIGFYNSGALPLMIVGRTTEFQGGFSIFNPFMYTLEAEKVSYSPKFNHGAGIIKIIPRAYAEKGSTLEIYTSLLEQSGTASTRVHVDELGMEGYSRLGLRYINPALLGKIVPDARFFPRILEFQHLLVSKIGTDPETQGTLETRMRLAEERTSNEGSEGYGITDLRQASSHRFLFLTYGQPVWEGTKLKVGVNYEEEKTASNHTNSGGLSATSTGLQNRAGAIELEGRMYSIGLQRYSLKSSIIESSKNIEATKAWGELKYIVGSVFLKPSASLAYSNRAWARSYGLSAVLVLDGVDIEGGVLRMGNFIINNNGTLGSTHSYSDRTVPEQATHYSLGAKSRFKRGIIEEAELLLFMKSFLMENKGQYSKGGTYGIDLSASKRGKLSYSFIASVSSSNIGGDKIIGSIDKSAQAEIAYALLPKVDFTAVLRVQDAPYVQGAALGTYQRKGPLSMVHMGFTWHTKTFGNNADWSLGLQNMTALLKDQDYATIQDANGNRIPIKSPFFVNLGMKMTIPEFIDL